MKLRNASTRWRITEIGILHNARRTATAWSRPLKVTETSAEKAPGPSRLLGFLWSVPVGLQLSMVYALLVTVTLALLGWALYNQLDGFLVQNTAQRFGRITHPIPVRPPRGPATDLGAAGDS